MTASVYERVLGAQFDALAPSLRRYFGAIADGCVGRGDGVYAVAGSRWRMLHPLLAALAARDILFPERGTGVGLRVENRYDPAGTLHAVRSFVFADRTRRMVDALRVEDGRLVDRLGRRGGVEVRLDAAVSDGGLVLASSALAWRVGVLRVPLPRVVAVRVSERVEGADPTLQHVDVRVRAVLLGEVFRYSGTFRYRVEAERG